MYMKAIEKVWHVILQQILESRQRHNFSSSVGGVGLMRGRGEGAEGRGGIGDGGRSHSLRFAYACICSCLDDVSRSGWLVAFFSISMHMYMHMHMHA